MISIICGILLILLLFVDIIGWFSLPSAWSPNYQFFAYFAFHSLISILVAIVGWTLIPFRYKYPMHLVLTFLIVFLIFTGSYGIFSFMIILIMMNFFKPKHSSEKTLILEPLSAYDKLKMSFHKYGMGGALKTIQNETRTQKSRIEALLAISSYETASTNVIIKEALRDSADQIRLLAFASLDKQENNISSKIATCLIAKDKAFKSKRIAGLNKQLGLLYWEYVYNNILEYELKSKALVTATDYLQQALVKSPNDGKINITLAKIYTYQKDWPTAYTYYAKATEVHVHKSQTVPYLAELAFYNKDYDATKALLTTNKLYLSIIPQIGDLAKFWANQNEH